MKIPKFMFRQSVTIEELTGHGAYGKVYAAAYSVKGKLQFGTKILKDKDANEVVSTAQFYMGPEHDAPAPGSRLTFGTTAFEVIESKAVFNPLSGGDVHHIEVMLT